MARRRFLSRSPAGRVWALLGLFCLCSLSLAAAPLRSLDCRKEQPSWKLVAGGSMVATPMNTSYGFAMLTDGRTISAIGKSGNLLWERSIKGSPTGYLTEESDFLLVVTNRDTLNLVNPSGITLWSAKTGFDIIENPRMARDGRILIRGKEHIACYGLHGVRKWLLRTERQRPDIPLMLFPDGSIFTFLSATDSNKSRAELISVFGEEKEITTFTAYVTAATETERGALLALKGGGAGLCQVEEGKAESKWVTQGVTGSDVAAVRVFSDGETAGFFWQSGGKGNLAVSLIHISDGTKGGLHLLGPLSLSRLTHLSVHQKGVCISDDERALLFGKDGTIFWEALLPDKKFFSGLFYTAEGLLLVYRKDWLMQAFVMEQTTSSSPARSPAAHFRHRPYTPQLPVTGTLGQLSYQRMNESDLAFIRSSFARGDYSSKEKDWAGSLQLELRNWHYDLNTGRQRFYDGRSYFLDNPVYCEELLHLAPAAGTADYAPLLADLLGVESRKELVIQLLHACGQLGWDDSGVMLTAMEELLHKAPPRDTVLLKAICDATYDICRYMGKPVLLKKGKNMLSFLLFPQFDSGTRDYARKTIKNILDLGL